MFKLFSYLRRGHAVYTSLAMGILNFLAVQYSLVISDIPWLAKLFPSITWFGLIMACIYIPVAIFLGRHDFKQGSMAADCENTARANPYSRDLAQALIYISAGENDKAQQLLSKWI